MGPARCLGGINEVGSEWHEPKLEAAIEGRVMSDEGGSDNESKFDTFKMCAESLVTLHNGGWPAECVVNLPGVTGWKWKKG
jgi:hypothetical protein